MATSSLSRKSFSKQFIRYFGVALIGYIVDFGTLIFLSEVFDIHYLISATAGFSFGLIVVYILSNRYVFGESKIKNRAAEFAIFAFIGVIGLGLLNALMFLFTEQFGIYYIASKIIATIVVYLWNFIARRSLYKEPVTQTP